MRKSRPVVYPQLRARIAELDLTNVEVAQRADVHPHTITYITRGVYEPSDRLRSLLAEILDAPAHELFAPADEVTA